MHSSSCALVSATQVAIFFSPELAFGHSKQYLLRFAQPYRTPIECRLYEKIYNDRTYSLVYECPDVCLSSSSLYGDHLAKLLLHNKKFVLMNILQISSAVHLAPSGVRQCIAALKFLDCTTPCVALIYLDCVTFPYHFRYFGMQYIPVPL